MGTSTAIDDSWAPAQIIGMIAVCPVRLQSLEHWGRTEKGGFSKAQEALVAQARILEWVAVSSSRGSSGPRN